MLWTFIATVDMLASTLALVVPWVQVIDYEDATKKKITGTYLYDLFELEHLANVGNDGHMFEVKNADKYDDQWATIFSMAVLTAVSGILGYGAVLASEGSDWDKKYFKFVGVVSYPLQAIFIVIAIALHYVVAGNVKDLEHTVFNEHYAGPVLYFILLAHAIALSIHSVKVITENK